MLHTTSPGSLAANSLLSPVVMAELGRRVATLGTRLLLQVKGTGVAAAADAVGFGVATAERCRSLGLQQASQRRRRHGVARAEYSEMDQTSVDGMDG